MYYLVLDVGTTGIKALLFSAEDLKLVAREYTKISKNIFKDHFVEQNPQEYLNVSKRLLKSLLKNNKVDVNDILALGIANQRETIVSWDKKTGNFLYPAIVWQDNRTLGFCSSLIDLGYNEEIKQKTGLRLDPYFSASKIHWLLDKVEEVKFAYNKKTLAIGTIDSWLLWNFLEDPVFLTDYTNASRTLLFNIKSKQWDNRLLQIFEVDRAILPDVKSSTYNYGVLKKEILGKKIPILVVCGDQQASIFPRGYAKGKVCVTYGTGTFIMQVIGEKFLLNEHFFTTIVSFKDKFNYVLEAKIDCCGPQLEKVLGKQKQMQDIFYNLSQKVDFYLKRLPFNFSKIYITGGLTRSVDLSIIQEEISHKKVENYSIYDGTGLGIASMLKKYCDS